MAYRVGFIPPTRISSNVILGFSAHNQNEAVNAKVPALLDMHGTNHMSQGTTSRQGTLIVDAQGFKAIQFNTVDQQHYLSANSYTQASTITMICAVSFDITAASGAGQTFIDLFKRNINNGGDRMLGETSTTRLRAQPYVSSSIVSSPNSTLQQNVKCVLTYTRKSDGTINLYYNQRLVATQLVTPDINLTSVQYRFSGNPANPAQALFVGNLYNGLIIHEEITGNNLQQLIRNSAVMAGIRL
jgi:hypothetical protein